MKYLLILLLAFLPGTDTTTLSGRYFADFDGAGMQDGYVEFRDSVFSLKHYNLLPYGGKIEYAPHSVYLMQEPNGDVFFEIRNEYMTRDTMPFSIHSKKAHPGSYMDISIGGGKFIRVR
ncbi:MAG TPA: hypothetical protein VK183_14065 [Flavobacterium sp.]|nr:hypothetical protein [Flavobacterium sp.]